MTTQHKQVRVRARGQDAYVDEGIAPLIREMWRSGIETCMSCQEGAYGFVWLHFGSPADAAKFLNIVAEYDPDPDSLYQRMLGRDVENPNSWIHKIHPEDINLMEDVDEETDMVEEWHSGKPVFQFFVSIWFPPSDLPAVMDRFVARRRAREARRRALPRRLDTTSGPGRYLAGSTQRLDPIHHEGGRRGAAK